MSFRKCGGTNFNAKHNNVSSNYNNTNNLNVHSGVAYFDYMYISNLITANGGIKGPTGTFEDVSISNTLNVDGVIYAKGGIETTTLSASDLITANYGISVYNNNALIDKDLQVNGNVGIQTTPSSSYALSVSGSVNATSYNSTSDYRIKENIQTLDDMYTLDFLRPVSYTNTIVNKYDIGLIANELQEIYPFMVSGEKDGENLQTINYTSLIGIMIKEIKELKKEVSLLKNK